MVLIPRFELSQNDNAITIKIHAPYTKISETEIHVDKDIFYFHSQPYFLRLKLPGEIEETDSSRATYNCDSQTFILELDKVNKGEHFEGLDMITTLLAPPKKSKNIVPTIEVIENRGATENDELESNDEDDDENDWHLPQVAPSLNIIPPDAPKYGFANKLSGVLGAFDAGILKGVISLPDPDTTPMNERKSLREADERQHFSDDHYILDMIEIEDNITPSINFIPEWYNLTSNDITYTDNEKDILKELPNKEFLLDSKETQIITFGLIDILFGSCYTHRVTKGENTVESSWDINIISATLSWLASFDTMEEVIITAMRRTLCYPLYRNWELSLKVFEDVKTVMKLGKKYILKRFCEIYELFNNSFEPRYLLNQLYIRDYLIYIQRLSDSSIELIIENLTKINPIKANMNLDLDELEMAAALVIKEEKKKKLVKTHQFTKHNRDYINDLECPLENINHKMNKLSFNDEKLLANNNIDSDDTTSSECSTTTCCSSSCSTVSSTSSDSSESDSSDSDSNSSESDSDSNSNDSDSNNDNNENNSNHT